MKEFEIVRMDKELGLGKVIAVFHDRKEAYNYIDMMNKTNGKNFEYFIW